jgi:hypothetical protein
MKIRSKLKSMYARFFRKKICVDCKKKLDKEFGLKNRLKSRIRKTRSKLRSSRSKAKKRLKAGIHMIKIKGGKMRKVRVLANGQYRFMKNRR